VVRRREYRLGAPDRPARDELPDQQRGQGRTAGDLRRDPGIPHRGVPSGSPAGAAARVSQGLVVVPTDSATATQRAKYRAYADARTPRTSQPQGPQRLLFARDLVGTSARIAEELYAHHGFQQVREVVFALPFSFAPDDYLQILGDIASHLGPALGWRRRPRSDNRRVPQRVSVG